MKKKNYKKAVAILWIDFILSKILFIAHQAACDYCDARLERKTEKGNHSHINHAAGQVVNLHSVNCELIPADLLLRGVTVPGTIPHCWAALVSSAELAFYVALDGC